MRKIRIIHLEDDPASASLIDALLAEDGLHCDIARVDTAAIFTALLELGGFDLVLASSTVPGMEGMAALALAREKRPALPFIFVTGAMGEELAIESLKSGAADYVLKGRLSRLAPAVRHALEDAARRPTAREASWRSAPLFVQTLASALVGMYLSAEDGRILTANSRFCDFLGYSAGELADLTEDDLIQIEDLAASRRVADDLLRHEGQSATREVRYLRKDGRTVLGLASTFLHLDEDHQPVCFVTQVEDISVRKNQEHLLRHARKLEAVGRLACATVHDLNNLLLVIIGHSSMLAEDVPEGPLAEHLQRILSAADRAAERAQSLLSFSRKQPAEMRLLNLNEVVGRVERLMTAGLPHDVQCVVNPYGEDLPIMGDVGQLEQVVMNLVNNALDALPQQGVVTLGTGIAKLDGPSNPTTGFCETGRFALFTVSDNGVGMDEETRLRIFEPFFTTKEAGKGTGLGLSIADDIVKEHHGFINCCSDAGKGTTFAVYLPLAEPRSCS